MGQNINMNEQRKFFRYKTLAKARLIEVSEGENLLKDISITGCLVECTSYAGIETNKQYNLEVKPESAAKIGTFELLVETKWMRAEAYSCEIGFAIVKSPKGKLFQRYVDYLSWRYSQGNSMTGSGILDTPADTE